MVHRLLFGSVLSPRVLTIFVFDTQEAISFVTEWREVGSLLYQLQLLLTRVGARSKKYFFKLISILDFQWCLIQML